MKTPDFIRKESNGFAFKSFSINDVRALPNLYNTVLPLSHTS